MLPANTLMGASLIVIKNTALENTTPGELAHDGAKCTARAGVLGAWSSGLTLQFNSRMSLERTPTFSGWLFPHL